MRSCPRCGAELRAGAKFCHRCGAKVESLILERTWTHIDEFVKSASRRGPAYCTIEVSQIGDLCNALVERLATNKPMSKIAELVNEKLHHGALIRRAMLSSYKEPLFTLMGDFG